MSATSTLIPVEEYLQSTYHPDRDYVEGELQERNMGEIPHGTLQAFFCWYFRNRREEWQVRPIPEQRVQVSDQRYRIPDVCVLPLLHADELTVYRAPLLCIEILSRADSMTELLKRVEDYQRMGVPAVWIIDPWLRKAFTATPDGSFVHQSKLLVVPETLIAVPVEEIFAELPPAE